mgnify:CR=1 FL=1|tara:strand:- start:739 stop:2490 length:1752 start_codon:yes stop_codon:yes gene_type:complete
MATIKLLGDAPNQVSRNKDLGDMAYQDAENIAGDVGVGGSVTATSGVINANTSDTAFRITQTGSGNALVVEDSANPDSTPFVVDTSGDVVIGYTQKLVVGSFTPTLQIHGAAPSQASVSLNSWATGTDTGSNLIFCRGDAGSINDYSVVDANDVVGNLRFYGADGTGMIESAKITAQVDGTPGTNDMPGRLVFSTTADGASSPTERMRIDSAGNVGIGINSPQGLLHLTAIPERSTFDGALSDFQIIIQHGGNTTGYYEGGIAFSDNGTDPTCAISPVDEGASGASGLAFGTGNITSVVERLRIDSSGNVGIGTTSPNAPLEVSKASAGQLEVARFRLEGATNNPMLQIRPDEANALVDLNATGSVGSQALSLSTSSVERLRIDGSGNVGIGTSSPIGNLTVASQNRFVSIGDSGTNNVAEIRASTEDGLSDSFLNIRANDLRLLTGGSESVRITSTGVVEINTGYVTLNGNKIGGIQVTIADDAFAEITPPRLGAGFIAVVEGGDEPFPASGVFGFVYADWGSSTGITNISVGASFATSTGGPPTGTTGTDGLATLFVGGTSGKIYIENRFGSVGIFQLTFT